MDICKKTHIYCTDSYINSCLSHLPRIDAIYAGCQMIAGLDSEGEIKVSSCSSYLRNEYWNNMKMLAMDKYHNGVVFGLKKSGVCIVCKTPFAGIDSISDRYCYTTIGNNCYGSLLKKVHSFKNIVQIAATGSLLLALDSNGKINVLVYCGTPNKYNDINKIKETIVSWDNIHRILIAEENIIIAQKINGELVFAGFTSDLLGNFGKEYFFRLKNKEIVSACSFHGAESINYAFLDILGNLYTNFFYNDKLKQKYKQIAGLDHFFLGLTENGNIIKFFGDEDISFVNWPKIKQIDIGRKEQGKHDNLYVVGLA